MANATIMAAPASVLDVLYGLVEGEMNSIFRFMEEGSPYLSRAKADIRRPLIEMVQTNERHIGELMAAIDELGGIPPRESIQMEEQYLAFLSLKFLLPKLIEAKHFVIERYDNALKALGHDAPPEVNYLLNRHLEEHQAHLAILEDAASRSQGD